MKIAARLLLLGVGLASPAIARAEGPVARYAIVIGNNLPEDATRGALRYADDDAVVMHRVFVDAGVRSYLLVTLDEGSRRLYPTLARDGAPRWADLERVLGRVRRDLQASAGRETELFFFFSGHGDVEQGEGYVRLEDRRLTRTMLHDLLARTPATRKHVLIDACKAYFVAFEKGAGGQRTPYLKGFVAHTAPAQLANTGFLLSTSSDRDSHEWERYQAGVFTHALRSALRGAADADGDGQISYAELGAFLATSGEAIANPRFRPDFVVRPPGRPADLSSIVLRWSAPANTLVLDLPLGHVYVETARGDRIADAHSARGHVTVLRLPSERPLFLRRGDERGEYVLRRSGTLRASMLARRPVALARKGALQLAFEQLFSVPFGPDKVSSFQREWARSAEEETGPMIRVEQPPPRSRWRPFVLWTSGLCAIGAAAGGLTLSAIAIQRWAAGRDTAQVDRVSTNSTLDKLNLASIVLYSVAAVAGGTYLGTKLWWRAAPARVEVTLPPSGIGLSAAATF